eukprot:8231495-Alexandrium_andersonii.AAC.1
MSASLVGSEMCIRDSTCFRRLELELRGCRNGLKLSTLRGLVHRVRRPVSYTHLTLPTICSV